MNRAIKFRARHGDRMISVHRLEWNARDEIEHIILLDYEQRIEHSLVGDYLANVTLLQSTGILDKHGREIYEGDIVAIGSTRIEVQFGLFAASELAIADGHEWEDTSRAMAWNINEEDAARGEVIGNIYEHPELLKVSNL